MALPASSSLTQRVAALPFPPTSTPSPTFRSPHANGNAAAAAAQPRTMKTAGLPPPMASVAQVLAGAEPPRASLLRAGTQQPSPTTSTSSIQSRRSPPPDEPPFPAPPPGPQHTMSAPAVPQQQPPPAHGAPPPPPAPAQGPMAPRAIRAPPPGFLAQLDAPAPDPALAHAAAAALPAQSMPGLLPAPWQLTPELYADFERFQMHQAQLAAAAQAAALNAFAGAPGTGGVAYAGGAVSNKVYDPPGFSPPHARTRSGGSVGGQSPKYPPADGAYGPPKYPPPPDAPPAIYGPPAPAPREQPYRVATPSGLRQSTLAAPDSDSDAAAGAGNGVGSAPRPAPAAGATPPLAKRPPEDRMLPFQEEPEDDDATRAGESSSSAGTVFGGPAPARWRRPDGEYAPAPDHAKAAAFASPAPGALPGAPAWAKGDALERDRARFGGRVSRAEHRPDDDSATLAEPESGGEDAATPGDGSATPRTPALELPGAHAHARAGSAGTSPPPAHAQANPYATIRARPRAGTGDARGAPGFDPAIFQHTLAQLQAPAPAPAAYLAPAPAPAAYLAAAQQATPQHYAQALAPFARAPYPLSIPGAPALRSFYAPPSDGDGALFDALAPAYGGQHPRPGNPVPPTPRTQTAAPSPSPLLSDALYAHAPAPAASPYPYPYEHVRRAAAVAAASAPSPVYDAAQLAELQAALANQRRMYALNSLYAGPSELSSAGTPLPVDYAPWNFLTTSRAYAHPGPIASSMSLRSSPSHEPVPLPRAPRPAPARRRPHPLAQAAAPKPRVRPPPRVESTQPRETSPEPTSGEETAGEEPRAPAAVQASRHAAAQASRHAGAPGAWADAVAPPDGEGEWAESGDEDDDEDALELEFHPSYVAGVERRRKRWDTKYAALVKAFQALDRETDATLVLLAAPSHPGGELRALTSRAIRRDPSLLHAPALPALRDAFAQLAGARAASRSVPPPPLADRLRSLAGTPDGAPGGEREEELRRMLGAALASLDALGGLYEQREVRWRDEVRRQAEDRDAVDMLLRQALGAGFALPGGGTYMGEAV